MVTNIQFLFNALINALNKNVKIAHFLDVNLKGTDDN